MDHNYFIISIFQESHFSAGIDIFSKSPKSLTNQQNRVCETIGFGIQQFSSHFQGCRLGTTYQIYSQLLQ